MSNLDSQRQESLKMRWQERRLKAIEENQKINPTASPNFYTRLLGGGANPSPLRANPKNNIQMFPGGFDDDLVSALVPPLTVVLEGRSICHRISLDKHTSYQSLARALRQMFVDGDATGLPSDGELDLSNAIPGHLIAYEDMENDLLLVGDLNWNDFVRVAKRIRILPIKANSRKGKVEN
ncbi:auxin-responsive protein IAA33-like [Coffea arabica]|uniref:Auxin-responsive protein n=1 Tax=Coffea arabica TaxID=13443 RepID=A0ABM4USE2_COFAR